MIILAIVLIFHFFLPIAKIISYLSLIFPRIELMLLNIKYMEPSFFTYLTLFKQSFWISILFFYRKTLVSFKYFEILYSSYIFSLLILISLFSLGAMTARIGAFFSIVEFVLLPMLIGLCKTSMNKFLLTLFFVFYSLFIAWFNIIPRHVVRDFYLIF